MSLIAGSVSLVEGTLIDWVVEQPPELPQLPVGWLNREQAAAELQRVVAQRAMLAAYEARLVLAMADDSPEAELPPPAARGSWTAEAGPPGVSEFFPAELSMVLNCGRGTASHLIQRAWAWRTNLPGTFGALAAGVLDEGRAKVLADVLGDADPQVARRVEAQLLDEAAGLSLRKLRERALAVLVSVDAEAADRRRAAAERSADVRVFPAVTEGMATVAAELPADEAAAAFDSVDRLAQMLKADGDQRPIGQLRTRVLADLLLRPWDTTRPPVTAHLQVSASLATLAGTSSEAGEVSGLAITAGHVRELVRQLDGCGVQAPAGGSMTVAVTNDDGALLATATPAQLRALARRGCPDHTDSAHPGAGCGCAVLARPAAVDAYAPSRPQQRFVRTRDRTCRFPNCGQRVGWADADHVVPHSCGGETDCANLCCLCRSHHRLKTFAVGWRFEMTVDGVLTVTTPSGITRTTRPPALRPPPEPPTPAPDTPAPETRAPDTPAPPATDPPTSGSPSGERPPDDDPPPF